MIIHPPAFRKDRVPLSYEFSHYISRNGIAISPVITNFIKNVYNTVEAFSFGSLQQTLLSRCPLESAAAADKGAIIRVNLLRHGIYDK